MERDRGRRLASTPRDLRRTAGLAAGLVAALSALSGCESDSYMDPSVIGRWEATPTTVPILESLSAVEAPETEPVEYTPVTAADLLPDPEDYRVGPGDGLAIKILGLVERDAEVTYERNVDLRGLIDIPQLGRIYVAGMNVQQIREVIISKAKTFIDDPLVDVDVASQRQQTFTILGSVTNPGPYFIPTPDYKLLEAITSGGRFDETVEWVYVIRQVPLDAALITPTGGPPVEPAPDDASPVRPTETPAEAVPAKPKAGEDLLKVIDDLSGEKKPEVEPSPPPSDRPPMPAALRSNRLGDPSRLPRSARQPADADTPRVDLIDDTLKPRKAEPAPLEAANIQPQGDADATWVFLNGKWVQSRPTGGAGVDAASILPSDKPASQLVTQRVIRVPLKQLLAGDSSLNLIVRPGDVIRLPTPPRGEFYVSGFVSRPGVYNLPEVGKMTIRRAIATAGGLNDLAIPERAEIIRVVGPAKQAIVRLDLAAIYEGTQPDVYIKPDDQINVGSSFWAVPVAVLRNGFRLTYGFGFLLDRNFGNDVFGPPPVNRFGD